MTSYLALLDSPPPQESSPLASRSTHSHPDSTTVKLFVKNF
ncbi:MULTISPECIES: hypothetical protein [unclassified Microcoleus]|nr:MULTISPECIES: hypothetical protein [unclassified Microcoleus]